LKKEVEILKIGSIIPAIRSGKGIVDEGNKESISTIMVVFDGGHIFDHYVSILKEKCGDEYKYLKTAQSIVGTPNNRPDRFSKFDNPSDTLKGIQNDKPEIGKSYGVENWYSSTVNRIVDEDILITRNSVYVIHDVSKLRDKKLQDLGF
jgi:hypothetical protein